MILAIETSCDETAIAIFKTDKTLLSHCLSSQIKVHTRYGGVVPELASRLHCEVIHDLIKNTLTQNSIEFKDITAIAVTFGPGLEGALLVGMTVAKSLSCILNVPLIPVNHMHGHLYAYFIEKPPQFPYLGVIVSGGHSEFILVKDHFQFVRLGQTRDDAVGEAFDKIARHLGLGYPGGPEIEARAKNGNNNAFKFPRAMKNIGYELSFSGLKTAVIEKTKTNTDHNESFIANICASFQEAVWEILWTKAKKACDAYQCKQILITGGVAANQSLQSYFHDKAIKSGIETLKLPKSYCTDNAAMIGVAAYYMQLSNQPIPPLDQIRVNPNLSSCP
jgi:N6-L-threonylcarbamoyladenine synthase